MNKRKKFLSNTELEIMQYIWDNTEVTASNIREFFHEKNWSKQTVNSFLRRLVNANFLNVRRESKAKYYYSAAITKSEYSMIPLRDIYREKFNKTMSEFGCALISSEPCSEEEIRKVKEMIAKYEKEMSKKSLQNKT